MAYVDILDNTHDIKIISVDKNCITEDTNFILDGNETFLDVDDNLGEHIYSPFEILDNLGTTIFDSDQLELIKESCEQNGAQYFRIVQS